jgi:signal transduction histidine kinase/DNA-binding response OmpR family regulator
LTATTDEAEKKLAYYKRRLDELAGENLKLDYQISGLQKDVRQKQKAFALLSNLQTTLGAQKEVSELFQETVTAINQTMGVDKTVVLVPTGEENRFRPAHFTGFQPNDPVDLEASHVFPPEFTSGDGSAFLLVHKATEETPLIAGLKQALALPFFVCKPVVVEKRPIGLILTGRLKEAGTAYPAFDSGDVETLSSIAGLISAVVQNMRMTVLQEMDKVKTEFFANISHEFRTPITLTLGPLEGMINGRYGLIADTAKEQASVMLRNQRRLLGLVNQILDLAKLESGKMQLKAQKMADLNAFCERIMGQFASMAEKRGLQHVLQFDPAVVGADIYLDREMFDKALFNLLSNAHKFTKSGSITLRTRVDGKRLLVEVQDTGIGMKADQLPHIFDRFRQADGSASREYSGTGIGLALVKEAVELHKGEVRVLSEYGKGTTFRFELKLGRDHLDPSSIIESGDEGESAPVAQGVVADIREGAQSDDLDVDAVNAEALAKRAGKKVVLYVDDNADLRRYVRTVLLTADYCVLLGINGKDGLEKMRQYNPDLVLSDLMMPVMNGGEFLKAVREDAAYKETPFVLLTAKSSLEAKIEGLETGADDYLNKPFSEPELFARLKNLIRMREQQLKIRDELRAARNIQQSLLPRGPVVATAGERRVSFEGTYHPCDELSGDFYDAVECGGWLYSYIADVTSHGTASAQVTYLVKAIFSELLAKGDAPPLEQLMQSAMDRYQKLGVEHDVGIQVSRLHPESRLFQYTRGNAPLPVRVAAPGMTSLMSSDAGPALTSRPLQAEDRFTVAEATLHPGERVFMFTDGCYEFNTPQGRQFGTRRLVKMLGELGGDDGWRGALYPALQKAAGGTSFDDDVTMICVRAE